MMKISLLWILFAADANIPTRRNIHCNSEANENWNTWNEINGWLEIAGSASAVAYHGWGIVNMFNDNKYCNRHRNGTGMQRFIRMSISSIISKKKAPQSCKALTVESSLYAGGPPSKFVEHSFNIAQTVLKLHHRDTCYRGSHLLESPDIPYYTTAAVEATHCFMSSRVEGGGFVGILMSMLSKNFKEVSVLGGSWLVNEGIAFAAVNNLTSPNEIIYYMKEALGDDNIQATGGWSTANLVKLSVEKLMEKAASINTIWGKLPEVGVKVAQWTWKKLVVERCGSYWGKKTKAMFADR